MKVAMFLKPLHQADDGSREALKLFLAEKNEKLPATLKLFTESEEFFKGRVFLELLWEYESRLKKETE